MIPILRLIFLIILKKERQERTLEMDCFFPLTTPKTCKQPTFDLFIIP
jgi:hypothetical protein